MRATLRSMLVGTIMMARERKRLKQFDAKLPFTGIRY
jgi:hypothetical protein